MTEQLSLSSEAIIRNIKGKVLISLSNLIGWLNYLMSATVV